jgi:uncharacterized protein (TIGR03437 family)
MVRWIWLLLSALSVSQGCAATFGSITTVVGSVSDIVLDESRRRLYLLNAGLSRLEVYSLPPNPIRLINTVNVDPLPLSAAMSRDNQFLYIAAYNTSSLNIVNLETLTVVGRPSLPARPEGVAVGADERVLITTIGTGANNTQNTLLIYDRNIGSLANVVVTPPAPQSPLLPPPSGRAFLTNRSRLEATPDGNLIVGVNIPNNNQRVVFVYEVASGTVLRSRAVNNISSVLSISPDGKKFMSGLTLFDLETLEILAQQNLANAPYPIQPGTNFNVQQNQGGSVFIPDGSALLSAFNIAPVQNPPSRPNVSQLMWNDPDNLLIQTAFQMPENLAGKMVMTSDGNTIYAVSESGFTTIPIGNVRNSPILEMPNPVILLANDQCGVTTGQRRQQVEIVNSGRGRITATAQVLQLTPAGPGGLGGGGGPGGGAPGGGIVIILPPVLPGLGPAPVGPQLPGGAQGAQNNAIFQTAPQVRTQQTADVPVIEFNYNTLNNRTMGTVSPVHDFLIQSNEAINIPPRLRVFQNNRDAEARADVRAVPVAISANEALEDIVYDPVRHRVYIANSGLNRIEVFDARAREFLSPIKVGQLPRSMALMPDNNTLYVANTGGESISIVDLNERQVVGRVRFPPLPFNAASPLVSPSVIAPTQRGPLMMMNNGTIWRVVGNEAIPRSVSPIIGSNTVAQPRNMVSTPNGEYTLLLAGNGFVYLYDAVFDEFVNGRQIFSNPIQGYYGPVAAGPGGRYFLVNGLLLNPALTPIGTAGTLTAVAGPIGGGGPGGGGPGGGGPGGGGPFAQVPANLANVPRPISAVVSMGANTYLRFTQPVRLQANNPVVSEAPVIEIANAINGSTIRTVPAVEGPLSTQTAQQRVNISGRTIAVDPSGTSAYALTTSGLSIIPLEAIPAQERPQIQQNGVVNVANLRNSVAPGSLVSIFGRNLGQAASSEAPLPSALGGVCATLNNRPLPLIATSSGQINAQIPPDLAAGRYTLVIRDIDRKTNSIQPSVVTVSRHAPAVMVDADTKQAAIYHSDGRPVDKQNPATRDQRLTLFAVGLGATKGGRVVTGQPSPSEPPAITDPVSVFFGDPRYREAAIVVEWSGLVPGMVGLYQINLYVPGDRIRGDNLDVTLRIGGVDSPTKGEMDPKVFIR